MHVLNVYKTYFPDPPGGLQEGIRQICLATTRRGIKNTIFTLSPRVNKKYIELPEASVVREKSWCAPASCDRPFPLPVKKQFPISCRLEEKRTETD